MENTSAKEAFTTTEAQTSTPPCTAGREISVKALPEYAALSASYSSDAFPVLVSIKAASLPSNEHEDRAPLDLVAVLDVSGSMRGEKLVLVKEAMNFVIENLGPNDKLSIVSFSTTANRVYKLKKMSDKHKERAIEAVNSLQPQKQTNIIAGLKRGIRVLENRKKKNPVASIILLSDGRDNENGSGRGFIQALHRLELLSGVPIHTFGFGLDHDATALHAVSEGSSGGTFSFVQSVEAVREAFAQCLGGLLSVAAQEVEVSLNSATPGTVRIMSISAGRHKNKLDEVSGQAGLIQVDELYAEEQKHFLVYVSVPRIESHVATTSSIVPQTQLLNIKCSFTNPTTKEKVTISSTSTVVIPRPDELSDEEKHVNLDVDRQKNRVMVSEAIAKAQQLAEKGDIKEARGLLDETREKLMLSPSSQAEDPFCGSLEEELREIKERMRSKREYETNGRGYTLAKKCSLQMQRASTQAPRTWRINSRNTPVCKKRCHFVTGPMRDMVEKATKKSRLN